MWSRVISYWNGTNDEKFKSSKEEKPILWDETAKSRTTGTCGKWGLKKKSSEEGQVISQNSSRCFKKAGEMSYANFKLIGGMIWTYFLTFLWKIVCIVFFTPKYILTCICELAHTHLIKIHWQTPQVDCKLPRHLADCKLPRHFTVYCKKHNNDPVRIFWCVLITLFHINKLRWVLYRHIRRMK